MTGLERQDSVERSWGDWNRSPVDDKSLEWIILARS